MKKCKKIPYRTRYQAWKAAVRYYYYIGTETGVYRCWTCFQYHLSKRELYLPPKKVEKMIKDELRIRDSKAKKALKKKTKVDKPPKQKRKFKNQYAPNVLELQRNFKVNKRTWLDIIRKFIHRFILNKNK